MIKKLSARYLCAILLLAMSTVCPVGAVTFQWDAATGDSDITDGGGTWQEPVGNWYNTNAVLFDQVWINGSDAVFGGGTAGTAGTVSLGGNVAPSRIIFTTPSAGTYTIDLAGFTLSPQLNSAGSVLGKSGFGSALVSDSVGTGSLVTPGNNFQIGLTGAMTISAQITGAGRIYTGGAGDLTLSNDANDFTGVLGKQNGGDLSISSIANSGVPSAAGAGSEVRVGFHAALNYIGSGDFTDRTLALFGINAKVANNGTGALVFTGAVTNQFSGDRTLTLTGSDTNSNDIQGVLTDNGSDVMSVTKSGVGTWILSGSNSYSGATTINDGTLACTAGNQASDFTVNAAGTLYGSGGIGDLTIHGQVSAGASSNAIGSLEASSLALPGDGRLQVDVSAMTGIPGTDWDLLQVDGGAGTVTVTAVNGSDFVIALTGSPTINNTLGYTNIIVDAGAVSGFDAEAFTVDTSQLTSDLGIGEFTVESSNGDLRLIFLPLGIPPIEWDGDAGDGLWTNAVNWTDDTLPVAGDNLAIRNGDVVTTDDINLLPRGCRITVSGGSTLNQDSGAVRLNGARLTVASDGALSGDFWDLRDSSITFEDGASVTIDDWENRGTNTFTFELGATGFTTLNANRFKLGGGTPIADAIYNVDLLNYTGAPQRIVLVDYVNNDAGITEASFQTATLNILNKGSYTNCSLLFDSLFNEIVLDMGSTDTVTTVISTPELKMIFDTNAVPVSLKDSAGTELLSGQASDGFYVLESDNSKRPFDAITDLGSGEYRFEMRGSNEQFTVRFDGTNDYMTVRFTSITNFPLAGERLFFGLDTVGDGVRDIPLDYMTVADANRNVVKVERINLWETSNTNVLGGFALYLYEDDEQEDETLLDLWVDEGLPHPKVTGTWDRATAEAWLDDWIDMAYDTSYLNIVPDTLAEHDAFLPYAAQMDAEAIYLWNLIWRGEYWLRYRQNDEINPARYPGGLSDLQTYRNGLATNDMDLMFHYLCGNIGEEDPEFTVGTVHPDLQSWGTVTLDAAVSASDTSFVVVPDVGVEMPVISTSTRPLEGPPVIPSTFEFKTFRIGGEWVSADSVTDLGNGTWQVSGVTRGQWSTSAASYSSGETLRGYLRPYDQDFVPDPNSALLETVATRWADLNNQLATTKSEFDGFENHRAAGSWGAEKFAAVVYQGLDHPSTSNTSGGRPPAAWLEYRFNRVKEALGGEFQTRQHASFFLGDESRITPGLEELENEMNKFFNVNNRGFSLGSYDVKGVSSSTLASHGLTDEVMTLLKDWKNASLAMGAEQRASMDNFRPFLRARVSLNGNHKWAETLWRLDGDRFRKWYALGTDVYSHEWHFGQEHGTLTPRFYLQNGDVQTLNVPAELAMGADRTRIIGRVLPRFDAASGSNTNLMTAFGIATSMTVAGTNSTGSAVWDNSLLTTYDLPSGSIDLSSSRGIGLWVTGDNSGATLVIRLWNKFARDYVVPINFTGRRWIEIPTGEQGWRARDWGFAAVTTWKFMDYDSVDAMSIGLGHLPANTTASVLVEDVTALAETAEALVDPTFTFGEESVVVTSTIPTESHFILDADGVFTVFDELWQTVSVQSVGILLPTNLTTFTVQSSSSTNIWLEVGVQAFAGETAQNPYGTTARGTSKSWLDAFGLVTVGDYEGADELDFDEDGLLNWEEFVAGTDPTDDESGIWFSDLSLAGNQLSVQWGGVSGRVYTVWYKTNILDSVWIEHGSSSNGVDLSTVPIDPNDEDHATGMIRVGIKL